MLERENEWPIGEDGLPTRDAARVILIDNEDRVLLVQGHDGNAPSRQWWFTVGGGQEPGESARDTAVRECFEETGYALHSSDLIGPVIYRDSKFFFADRTRRQREHFFIARVNGFDVTTRGWSNDERNVLDDMRWLSMAELREIEKRSRIYPQALPDLLGEWLMNGWDGECVKIDEYND
jgi:8-oxo-dGTP pyrophosphatase MutT (NUDIX family)